jgi:hypothetical protein
MGDLLDKSISTNRCIRVESNPPSRRQKKPGDQLDVRTVGGHHKHAPTGKLHPVLRTECVEKVLAQAGVGEGKRVHRIPSLVFAGL